MYTFLLLQFFFFDLKDLYGGTPWVFCLLAPCLSPGAVAILSPALWNMLTPALNLDRAQTEVCLGPFDRTGMMNK